MLTKETSRSDSYILMFAGLKIDLKCDETNTTLERDLHGIIGNKAIYAQTIDVFCNCIKTSSGMNAHSESSIGVAPVICLAEELTAEGSISNMLSEECVSYLHFLNESAFQLADLHDVDHVYSHVGEAIFQLLDGTGTIVIYRATERTCSFVMQGIYGLDETQRNAIGDSLIGSVHVVTATTLSQLKSGHLVRADDEFLEPTQETGATSLPQQLKQVYEPSTEYRIGLQQGETLFAGIQIILPADHTMEAAPIMEAVVEQTAMALQRIHDQKPTEAFPALRYRSLFEQSNDAVFILNLNGKHVDVNQRALEMMGYTWDEMIRLRYADLIAPGELPKSKGVLERLLAGEHIPPYERVFRRKDGQRFPTEINVEIVRDDRGEPLYIQSIVRDISERKQSERRAQLTLQGTRAGTWEWNVQTGETVFNDRWAEIVGYTLDELAPVNIRTWIDLCHPDDRKLSTQLLEAHFAGESDYYACEVRMKHKAGHWVWVLDTGSVLEWTDDGRPLLMFGTHMDITHSKELEQQVRQRESHLRSLVETETTLVMRCDLAGRYTYVNQAFAEWVGYPPQKLIGLPVMETIDLKDHQKSNQAARQALAQPGKSVRVALNKVLADGTQRHALWEYLALTDEVGVVQEFQCMGFDISEQYEMQQALADSEERLRTIVQNIPVMIAFFDEQGHFEYVNQHWIDVLGWSAEELAAYDEPLSVFYPDAAYRRKVRDFMVTAQAGWHDFETLTRSGKTITTTWANVRLSDGRTIGIGRDITLMRQAQARQYELALEKARVDMLTSFFRDAAHEFRTPLSVIHSSTSLILRLDDPARREKKALQIQDQIQRITRLVDSLLLLTRMEGNSELIWQRLHIEDVFRSACNKAAERCTAEHELRCDVASDLPVIVADVDLLHEALSQLMDNACRFTAPRGRIEAVAKSDTTHIHIQIRDTGQGIGADALPHIFETFWRQDTAHTTPGFGLGLPIARRIIEKHGGTIAISSEVGVGTIVDVQLPIAQPKAEAQQGSLLRSYDGGKAE